MAALVSSESKFAPRRLLLVTVFLVVAFFMNWILGVIYFVVSSGQCRASPTWQNAVKAMALRTSRVFRKNNIPYFTDGGTMLGCAREKDMIAHDTDIDLAVWQKDAPRIKRLLEEEGLTVVWSRLEGIQLLRVFDKRYPLDTRFMHVDLNIFTRRKDNPKMVHDIQTAVDPEKKYYRDSWLGPGGEPSQNCTKLLGDLPLQTPCDIHAWLAFQFGPNYMKKVVPRWEDCKNAATTWLFGYKV